MQLTTASSPSAETGLRGCVGLSFYGALPIFALAIPPDFPALRPGRVSTPQPRRPPSDCQTCTRTDAGRTPGRGSLIDSLYLQNDTAFGMPEQRQAHLSRLVDRSIKASTALVILLTLAGLGTACGLLWAQQQVAARFEVIVANDVLADQVQSMRLRLGAWALRGDNGAREDWKRLADDARRQVTLLRTMRGGRIQGELVGNIGARLADRIGSALPLLDLPSTEEARERVVPVLVGRDYQARNERLTAAIASLSSFERDELTRMHERQRLILSVAGALLFVLVPWSVLTLRRSRRTARTLIVDLRNAFETIDRRQAELVAFTDAAPHAVFHLDAAGVPVWLNSQAAELAGSRAGSTVAVAMRGAVHPEDWPRVEDSWGALVTAGSRFDEVFRLVAADGRRMWARAHAVPVRAQGKTTGIVAVLEDISGERALQDELAASRGRLRRMADTVPALIARLDVDDTYRFVNRTYQSWFGDHAPRVGSSLAEFLGEATFTKLRPVFERVRRGEAVRTEMRHDNLHGRSFVGDVTYTPDFDSAGRYCGFYVLVTDITERKRLEESVFAAKELAQVTLDAIHDAVITTDRGGVVTSLNHRAEALCSGRRTGRGQFVGDLVSLHDGDGTPTDSALMRAIDEQRVVEGTHPRSLVLADGTRMDVEDVAAPIRDRAGHVVGGVLVLRDVSIAQAAAERMRQLAESDVLTGLANRMVFDERLRRALGDLHEGGSLAVLYMDLDGFKAVNDVHGHNAGDDLLRGFASRLRTIASAKDTLCRLGGDEFVALLGGEVSVREALVIAARFVEAAGQPFMWNGHVLTVTLSVGVALAPHHGMDALTLVRAADVALYAAKEAGKNQVRLAPPPAVPVAS